MCACLYLSSSRNFLASLPFLLFVGFFLDRWDDVWIARNILIWNSGFEHCSISCMMMEFNFLLLFQPILRLSKMLLILPLFQDSTLSFRLCFCICLFSSYCDSVRGSVQTSTTVVGQRANLTCLSEYSESISWRHGTTKVLVDNNKFNAVNSSLLISFVDENDFGDYQCFDRNNKTLSTVSLFVGPFVTVNLKSAHDNTNFHVGEQATFHCNVHTQKQLLCVEWFHNSVLISNTSASRYILTEKNTVLQIANLSLEDNGRIICDAFTECGPGSSFSTLHVRNKVFNVSLISRCVTFSRTIFLEWMIPSELQKTGLVKIQVRFNLTGSWQSLTDNHMKNITSFVVRGCSCLAI